MSYSCLIVDDENLALRLLEDYISKMPQLNLIGKCSNAIQALDILQKEQIDILFLDIQMPDLTGIELLKIIKNKPAVIFTTAYKEYALEGYQLDVIDYLLKPISFERFVQAVNKACAWNVLQKNKFVNGNLQSQTIEIPKEEAPQYFFVKSDYKQVKIVFEQISYVEGLREYVSIYTQDKRIITLETMKNMEILLPQNNFLRCHKSYIVNKQKVTAINGNMLELGKEKIPIGKSYKEEVLKML